MTLADDIAGWIRVQVHGAGLSGIVVGLSGGIDSAVVSGLCARALGAPNVLGLIMPIHSNPLDGQHAEAAARAWGIEHRVVDLAPTFDALLQALPPGSDMAVANIKPRLRMITLYHHANTLGRMVVGTGNRSELLVGYYTKYGDGGVDLLPLAGVYKRQVREIAREIGVPEPIISKPPSAGLWQGQTDEGEMGITYEQLDATLEAITSGQADRADPVIRERVERLMRTSEHKRQLPPIFHPSDRA
jgi:NAD+ synthase